MPFNFIIAVCLYLIISLCGRTNAEVRHLAEINNTILDEVYALIVRIDTLNRQSMR